MILFGGKGGVGKTTCAAAAALSTAETAGRRVLAVSTDPAPSLGDALRVRLHLEPTEIATRRGVLLAAELAAGPALGRWQAEHREELREIAARGTYLDPQDVDRFLDLAMPGADELIAWIEIARLARETACDEIVVDAAPTAHTLRLLAMPEALRGFARALNRLQERHRWMAERFGGAWRPDASDAFVAGLEAQAREIQESLRDPGRSSVYWVMLPEALSLEETLDALAVLDAAGIPVREVIVNRVLPPGEEEEEGCPLCRERRRAEAAAIREIRGRLGGRALRFLAEEEKEPRGKGALRKVGRALRGSPPPEPSPPAPLPTPPSLPHRERGDKKKPYRATNPPLTFSLFSRCGREGGVGRRGPG
jgi:arsenite-transporting ATPase